MDILNHIMEIDSEIKEIQAQNKAIAEAKQAQAEAEAEAEKLEANKSPEVLAIENLNKTMLELSTRLQAIEQNTAKPPAIPPYVSQFELVGKPDRNGYFPSPIEW